jgi:hypothetical protein
MTGSDKTLAPQTWDKEGVDEHACTAVFDQCYTGGACVSGSSRPS